jgi:hypothetical protein
MGKRAGLSVGKKRCAYKEQYPGGREQNIAKYLRNLWGEPTHQSMLFGNILSGKKGRLKHVKV